MLSDPGLIAEFVVESLEHLEAIEPLLLELEKRGETDASSTNEIFRAIHSIKGAAGFLGLENVSALSHALESLLMRLRDGKCAFRAEMADPLLRSVDALRALLRGLPEEQGRPATALVALLEALLDEPAATPAAEVVDPFEAACDIKPIRSAAANHWLLIKIRRNFGKRPVIISFASRSEERRVGKECNRSC